MSDNDYGYLRVAVRTAGGAIPVERAIVTVKDSNEALIGIFFTDEDGNTPTVRLMTPPKINSESPNAPGAAFMLYNIDTDRSGYRSVRNIGVPVYPGVTSVQPVQLIPLSEGEHEGYSDSIIYNESETPDL